MSLRPPINNSFSTNEKITKRVQSLYLFRGRLIIFTRETATDRKLLNELRPADEPARLFSRFRKIFFL